MSLQHLYLWSDSDQPTGAMNISESCFADYPDPNYTRHLLEVERDFDYWWAYYWLLNNWTACYYFIGAYLLAIGAGLRWMRHRTPFGLRRPLFAWNAALALFSAIVAIRVFAEIAYVISVTGFDAAVCDFGSVQHKQSFGVWAWLFSFSKVVELGDTAFIVLRKTPLIFLHWYHHVSVLFLVWSSSAWPSTTHVWFMAVNALVHAVMYSYYAIKVLGVVKIPKVVSMAVTSLQLVQMMAGVALLAYAYRLKARGATCCVFDQAIALAAATYLSYLVLFANFFVKAYITKKPVFTAKKVN